MSVIHIFKDGTEVTDITGHVVRLADAAPLYQVIDTINKRIASQNNHTYERKKKRGFQNEKTILS
jgi:hypothetical protein